MYIIAGPNGAGKTTLSYTILPEIFDCDEFVNADEIAKGISPLNPEKARIRAGRLMLQRIKELLNQEESFAFETTLSTRSYQGFVEKAKKQGYDITLLFLTLDSVELAINRVQIRVKEGGHNIPIETIERRYTTGLANFFKIYQSIVSKWIFVDNSSENFEFIAEGIGDEIVIRNENKWSYLNKKYMEISEQLRELEEQVSLGLKGAYRKMVEFKKRNNSPLIVSRNGKVTTIPPDEILPTTKAKNH
ncbi:zeta toxin [Fulvivirga sp. M361]|uniref:zeta toxin family protein n=1 Tax=Fulvivirga sp. M361 TaxID=2594266 RepID=UPI001179FE78|nr:zeta toxin family protein [Fulvivirga sp. M361]TRX56181.1 zeta toxin [Fulvivirga sp. M361]